MKRIPATFKVWWIMSLALLVLWGLNPWWWQPNRAVDLGRLVTAVHVIVGESPTGPPEYRTKACIAFPFDADAAATMFLSAGHCADRSSYFVAKFPTDRHAAFLAYRDAALDIAVFRTPGYFPATLKLGRDPLLGEAIVCGVGNGILGFGTVASGKQAAPPFVIFAQVPVVSGVSGSPVWCLDQRAVCGIIIGHMNELQAHGVLVPISNLKGSAWAKLLAKPLLP